MIATQPTKPSKLDKFIIIFSIVAFFIFVCMAVYMVVLTEQINKHSSNLTQTRSLQVSNNQQVQKLNARLKYLQSVYSKNKNLYLSDFEAYKAENSLEINALADEFIELEQAIQDLSEETSILARRYVQNKNSQTTSINYTKPKLGKPKHIGLSNNEIDGLSSNYKRSVNPDGKVTYSKIR